MHLTVLDHAIATADLSVRLSPFGGLSRRMWILSITGWHMPPVPVSINFIAYARFFIWWE